MTPKRKTMLRNLAVCLLLVLSLCLAACNESQTTEPTSAGNVEQVEYRLQLATQGGNALEGITVYIYADDTLADLVAFAKTDKDGSAAFTYDAGRTYVAVLVDVPEGYVVEPTYPITGEDTLITLTTELVQGDLDTDSYKLGDVMKDFTFTAADGTEYSLAAMLQEKKAVVLNFWYINCDPCRAEFPHLQEAYVEYADQIALLAMNPVDADNAEITALAQELGLTMPIGACQDSWARAMNISAYPTTVVIDRFGTIALMHTGSVPDTQLFKDVFSFFCAEDYTQTTVEDITLLATTEPEQGTATTPTEIGALEAFQLTIAAGGSHYVNIHKMQNVWMQINNSDIYVDYGGRKFEPSGGSIGMLVSAPSSFQPAQLIFYNPTDKDVTITAYLSNLPGSYDNPYELQPGQFQAQVSAGNNQGVYFRYTAEEDGYFSLQCLSVQPDIAYDFSVMNLTTSVLRNMTGDGQEDAETGNQAVVMALNQGEQLRITICALPDSENNYPAATFQMLAEFTAGDVEDIVKKEKIAYAVTVTDETRMPLAGINVSLLGTAEDAQKVNLLTNEMGVASAWLDEDVYTGTLMVPKGYTTTTTEFMLSPELTMISLKLDTVVIEYADYVVRVIDEDGNGVPGVLVTIGTTYGTTDENGAYIVNLVKGAYTAVIGVPDGYTSDSISYPFPENDTTLGITLKPAEPDVPAGIEYTVQVLDDSGMAMANVVVTFNRDGAPVSVIPVNSSGIATAILPAGDYIVTLTGSSGSVLGFEESQGIMTADKTSTVIYVATEIGGDNYKEHWWGNYYLLPVGSSRIEMISTVNYVADFESWMYVFAPEVSGIYEFTVTSGAVMGYYGGISFPNGPSLSTEQEVSFTVPVKEGEFANDNIPSYVLGIKPNAGVEYATVTITRIADAPEELPVVVYEATSVPVPFTPPAGQLTFVDITKQVVLEKQANGTYTLNGKTVYVKLSNAAPYLTFSDMLGLVYTGSDWTNASTGTGMKGGIYEDGVQVATEDFTDCMQSYIRACHPATGLYPLNDDLMYMIKSCGDYRGWWELDNPNYLFADVTDLNEDTAWMFACCYMN